MGLNVMVKVNGETVFDMSVTHNLKVMAKMCGLSNLLWDSKKSSVLVCQSVVFDLSKALKLLKKEKAFFDNLNHSSGWGTRKDFLFFVKNLFKACYNANNAELVVL